MQKHMTNSVVVVVVEVNITSMVGSTPNRGGAKLYTFSVTYRLRVVIVGMCMVQLYLYDHRYSIIAISLRYDPRFCGEA